MRDSVVPRLSTSAPGPRTSAAAAVGTLSALADVGRTGERAASRGQRFAARLVDVACFGAMLLVVQSALWTVISVGDPRLRPLVLAGQPLTEAQAAALDTAVWSWAWLVPVVTVLLWLAYEVPLTVLRGQTLGKMAVGIRVVTADPSTVLGWRAAVARWSLLGVPSALGVFGLPFQLADCAWLARRTAHPQCLHDRLAHTHVIAKPPTDLGTLRRGR